LRCAHVESVQCVTVFIKASRFQSATEVEMSDTEREMFEAYMLENGHLKSKLNLVDNGGEYVWTSTALYWKQWQHQSAIIAERDVEIKGLRKALKSLYGRYKRLDLKCEKSRDDFDSRFYQEPVLTFVDKVLSGGRDEFIN